MGAKINKLVLWMAMGLVIAGFALRYEGVQVNEWGLIGVMMSASVLAYVIMSSNMARAFFPMIGYGIVIMSLPAPIRKFEYTLPIISEWSRILFSPEANQWQYGFAAFGVSIGLNELICRRKGHRLLLASLILLTFTWYQYSYAMHLFMPLGFLMVYIVTSESVNTKRQRLEGLWAFIVAVCVLFAVMGVNRLLPYDKVNAWVMEQIPENWKHSSGEVIGGAENKGLQKWHSLYYPRGNLLGGAVEDRSGEVLFKVQSTEQPLYLRCAVYSVYDGHSWILESVNSRDVQESTNTEGMKHIYYEGPSIQTPIRFGPLGARAIEADGRIPYDGKDTDSPADVFLEVELPDKVKDYADQLLSGIESRDEKINVLMNTVTTHGQYSLSVTTPPSDMDFVEYFLFENQKGYCTYYATTLAVLLRESGIPSRYVEGFLVNPLKTERGKFIVTEQEGHAWVEAFIEGKGWVTLDPTPSRILEGNVVQTGSPVVDIGGNDLKEEAVDSKESIGTKADVLLRMRRRGVLIVILTFTAVLWSSWRISEKMLFDVRDRKKLKRLIGYFDYLFNQSFKDRPVSESIGRRAALWIQQDVSGLADDFDAIMEDVETALYAKDISKTDLSDRIVRFVKHVEASRESWLRKWVGRMLFLKGWNYGRNNG